MSPKAIPFIPPGNHNPIFHAATCGRRDSLADCAFILRETVRWWRRDTMRFVVIVGAALLSLGLAAFGFVSAQKAAAPIRPLLRRCA